MSNFKVSEIFYSVNGEGSATGIPQIFVRFAGCNLTCPGFSNKNNQLPELTFPDITNINNLNDIPVITTGCDSAYSWHPHFKKFIKTYSADELALKIIDVYNKSTLGHKTYQFPDICLTGGEPLLWQKQLPELAKAVDKYSEQHNFKYNRWFIETNGTQMLKFEFLAYFNQNNTYISCSPKLSLLTGEAKSKIEKIDVLNQYLTHFNGQLKYVVNTDQNVWDEMLQHIDKFLELDNHKYNNRTWTYWVMPAGGTKEQQEEIQQFVAEKALSYGLNFAARVHNWVWGNKIGK